MTLLTHSDKTKNSGQFWFHDYSSIWDDFLWCNKVTEIAKRHNLILENFSLVEFGTEKFENFIADVQKETKSSAVASLTAYSILEGVDKWDTIYANINFLRIIKLHCKKVLKHGVNRERILENGEKILEKESAPQNMDAAVTLVLTELDKIGRKVKTKQGIFGREIYVEKYSEDNFEKNKMFNGFLAIETDWLYQKDTADARGDCRMLSFLAQLVLTELGFKVEMHRIGVIDKGERKAHAYISVNGEDREVTSQFAERYKPGSLIRGQHYYMEYSPFGLAAEPVSGLAKIRADKIKKEIADEFSKIKNKTSKLKTKEQLLDYLSEKIGVLLKDIKLLENLLKYASRNTTVLDNISYIYSALTHIYSHYTAGMIKESLQLCEKTMEYAEKEIEIFNQYKSEAENKTAELKDAAKKRLNDEIEYVKNIVARYYDWYIGKGGQNFTRRFP